MTRLIKRVGPSLSFLAILTGYGVLTALSVRLFIYTMVESLRVSFIFAFVLGFLIFVFIIEHIYELLGAIKQRAALQPWRVDEGIDFISLVFAALLTFMMSHDLGLGPVAASALTGIIGAVAAPKYAAAIFCGSFVGMISQQVALGYMNVILSGVIAGLIYLLSKDVFNGFGGKLGTIAFSGCVLMSIIKGQDFMIVSIPTWGMSLIIILFSVLGAVLTFAVNHRLRCGPVLASGLVGLTGGLLLPILYPVVGDTLAVVFFCASFIGMSSTHRIKDEQSIAVAGFIAGIVFVFSAPHMAGAGGKLGTIAFVAAIVAAGLHKVKWYFICRFRYLNGD